MAKNIDAKSLLENTSDFISGISSNEEDPNQEGKGNEKYFFLKLKNQFSSQKCFSNIKINIKESLDEIKVYIPTKIFRKEKLDKKIGIEIINLFKNYFENESDIEIDTLFTEVSGEKVDRFFQLIEKYSYPDKLSINQNIKYNFVLLFVSNSQIKLFEELSQKIKDAKKYQEEEDIGEDIRKCFEFPFYPRKKVPNNKKKFLNESEKEENKKGEDKNKEKKKETDQKIFEAYRKFRFFIENINGTENFKLKLIYLDLYLNVIAPKSDIISQINELKATITAIGNEKMKNELDNTKEELFKTKEELKKTNEKLDFLVDYIKKKDPNFEIEKIK